MKALRVKAAAVLAALLVAASSGPVAGAQAAIRVGITVTFVPTSGACAALQAQFGFEVVCGQPVVFSSPGGASSPYARVFPDGRFGSGNLPGAPAAAVPGEPGAAGEDFSGGDESSEPPEGQIATGVAQQRLRLRQPGSAEISSWRLVSSDNGAYVELTIAW